MTFRILPFLFFLLAFEAFAQKPIDLALMQAGSNRAELEKAKEILSIKPT